MSRVRGGKKRQPRYEVLAREWAKQGFAYGKMRKIYWEVTGQEWDWCPRDLPLLWFIYWNERRFGPLRENEVA